MSHPDHPLMRNVASSNIAAIGHSNDKLHIRFRNGGRYVYDGVSRETYDKAVEAKSLGGFVHENIKGKYNHTRLNGEEPNAAPA